MARDGGQIGGWTQARDMGGEPIERVFVPDPRNQLPDGGTPAIEKRVTSETGGQKGSKLARFSLIPWSILRELAEHYGRGSRKYADRNWERGYAWSLSFDALQRHLESFWNRDEIDHDPSLYEDGEPHTARHIIAVLWHACCLAYFSRYGVGQDDRPTLQRLPELCTIAQPHFHCDSPTCTNHDPLHRHCA